MKLDMKLNFNIADDPALGRAVIFCSLANLLNQADRVVMPISLISIADEFNWSFSDQGAILSVLHIGYMTSMILGGGLAKQYGGIQVTRIAVFIWSLATLMIPFIIHSFNMTLVLRFMSGVGEGMALPAIFHIFAGCIPIEDRSRAFSYLMSMGCIGQVIAGLICPYLNYKLSFILISILGFIWVITWSYFHKMNPDCLVYSNIDLYNNDQTYIAQAKWHDFLTHWPLWAIYIAHFCMNWSNYIVMQWLPTYLVRYMGASKNGLMYAVFPYVFAAIFGIVAGHIADGTIKRKGNILFIRRLMTTIGLIGPALMFLLFSTSNTFGVAIFVISLSLGFSAFNSAGHMSSHAEVAPHHAGITFAISNTLAAIPGVLTGPFTAWLVTESHGRWFPVFIFSACLNIVGTIVYLVESSSNQLFQ